jgi:hypothetical protein
VGAEVVAREIQAFFKPVPIFPWDLSHGGEVTYLRFQPTHEMIAKVNYFIANQNASIFVIDPSPGAFAKRNVVDFGNYLVGCSHGANGANGANAAGTSWRRCHAEAGVGQTGSGTMGSRAIARASSESGARGRFHHFR